MTTTQLNKWRIFCETENTWVYKWLEPGVSTPSTCFTNDTHTVNAYSMSIIYTLDSNEITIKEETTKTQGNFRSEGFDFDIPAQSEYIGTISFSYPINLLSVWYNVNTENIGDNLTVEFEPLYSGTITADISSPTSSIQVDLITANILNIGYKVFIKRDSDNYTEHLGEVLTINKTTGIITVSNPTIDTFSIGDNVYLRVLGIKNMRLLSVGRHSIGMSKLGSTYIMQSGVFYVYYTNNTPLNTKNFYYELEYLY